MRHGAAAEYGPVVNVCFSCDTDVTNKNTVISHCAIVSHVGVGHKQGIAADLCNPLAAGFGASVDGGTFTHCHIVSKFHIGHFSVEFEVLRNGSHNGPRENAAVFAHLHIVENGGVGKDFAVVSDFDEFVNISVRAHFHIFAEFGIRVDAGKRMNLCTHIRLFCCEGLADHAGYLGVDCMS